MSRFSAKIHNPNLIMMKWKNLNLGIFYKIIISKELREDKCRKVTMSLVDY